MPARKSNTAIVIGLIIFAALSLILGVTTYLFVQRSVDERTRAETAEAELQQVRNELRGQQLDNDRLRVVIGTEATSADKVEAEHNDFLQTRFSAFRDDPKSLRRLAEWLDRGLQQREEQVAAAEAQRVKDAADKTNEVQQAETARREAQAALTAAQAQQMKESADFQEQRGKTEAIMNQAIDDRKKADGQVEAFELVKKEIAELAPLLSNEPVVLSGRATASRDRRTKFEAESTTLTDRVLLVADELRVKQQIGQTLNRTLARLGAADEAVQAAVRDARKVDSRIEGLDGRVSGVDVGDRTVTISMLSTAGLRPGLRFDVFGPDDSRPELSARKGVVQVTAIEGGTRVRARIVSDLLTDPILSGDGVASPLWSPGSTFEIAVVGAVLFPEGGDASETILRQLIARAGGRVVDELGATTRLVVDFGAAPRAAGAERRVEDGKRRIEIIGEARDAGIPIVGLDGLLDRLGLDRAELKRAAERAGEGQPAATGGPRPRDAAVAY